MYNKLRRMIANNNFITSSLFIAGIPILSPDGEGAR
jgi:hypothetical protein